MVFSFVCSLVRCIQKMVMIFSPFRLLLYRNCGACLQLCCLWRGEAFVTRGFAHTGISLCLCFHARLKAIVLKKISIRVLLTVFAAIIGDQNGYFSDALDLQMESWRIWTLYSRIRRFWCWVVLNTDFGSST